MILLPAAVNPEGTLHSVSVTECVPVAVLNRNVAAVTSDLL